MASTRRFRVNKRRSAARFRKSSRKSAVANLRSAPMRGGWRF